MRGRKSKLAPAPGSFVRCSEGRVHYQLRGPEGGDVVLLVHGFSSWSFAFDPIVDAFHDAGFRTLALDLYGRGYSDRPRGSYTLARFVRQAVDLLAALDIGGPIDVVGWSMGGATALSLADAQPQLVKRVGLIAPAGLPVNKPAGSDLLLAPLLGDVLLGAFGRSILLNGIARSFHDRGSEPAFMEQFRISFAQPGFTRALLSTLRHVPLDDLADLYSRAGRRDLPAMLVWGTEDAITPYANAARARQLLGPSSDLSTIAGAGHACLWEQPAIVAHPLVEFLSGRRPRRAIH